VCRSRINAVVDVIDLAAVWNPHAGLRGSAAAVGVRAAAVRRWPPAHEARLAAVASAFRNAWLVGAAAILAFAALAAAVGHARGLWLFLAVAPIVPCPALEPELITPYPVLRLILLRTIAVLALALPAVLLLGLAVPGAQAGFLALAATSFSIFLVRRRRLRQLRPWR
jgi:hypothetical protein